MPSIFQFEITGTATNAVPSTTVLQDSAATFITQRIQTGDTVYNVTDGQLATISSIDSETQLTCTVLSGGASWNSTDQYRIWVTDTRSFKFHIIDTLDYPMAAEITIADPSNSSEASFSDYQKVRILEDSTSLVVFSGKIETIRPLWDSLYGQILIISARDNLAELLKRTPNIAYSGHVRRSTLIASIIGNHVFASTNIDTTTGDFQASVKVEAATVLNTNFAGSGKNALRAIAEIAQTDPWSVDPATGFGYDYLLDTDFVAATGATSPDLWYFRRGSLPTGGALVNGLTVQFGAAESAQTRSMLRDYGFSTESKELLTRVRIEYVTASGASENENVILVNHGAVAGGPFQENELITWGANSATIKKVGSGFLLIAENPASIGTWLNTISGQLITGGTSFATATVNATTASPPGSLREVLEQDIEVVLREYDTTHQTDARNKAAEILSHGGNTITRGEFTIIGWPSFELLGTDYLVRAGHVIRVINSNAGINSDELVTHIRYDEGPGVLHARIEVMGTTRGKTVSRTILERIREDSETGQWQTIGSTGGLPESAQLVNIDFVFTTPAWNQFAWAGGTATYSDGSTQTINNTGSPYTIPDASIRYVYIIAGTATLQVSASFSDVVGTNKSLLAIAVRADVSTEDCKIVSMNQGSPVIAAGTIIANEISAFSANMGLLTAGAIRIPSGTANSVSTAAFTGFTLNGDRIAGYNAGVLQTELRSSDGHFMAGNNAVELGIGGIDVIGGTSGAAFVNFWDTVGGGIEGKIWANSGDLTIFVAAGNELVLSTDGTMVRPALATQFGDATRYWSPLYTSKVRMIATREIDSYADAAAEIYFITQNIARDANVEHSFSPSVSSHGYLGGSSKRWLGAYIDTLYTQAISRISGTGGDIGSATASFSNVFVGEGYNYIGGSTGDMDFHVKNTAGNASILAMYIADGDVPIVRLINGVHIVPVGTNDLGTSSSPFRNLYIGVDAVNRYISGSNGDMEFYGNGNRMLTLKDENAAANSTNIEIRLNNDSGVNVALITLGASDSGGAGYRLLRVLN